VHQDSKFKFERKLNDSSKLVIKQYVPKGAWHMVPTPSIQVDGCWGKGVWGVVGGMLRDVHVYFS
jgi:hypothetical protein